jgi:uncharacterized peroxidase-related enzyme
MRHDRTGHAQGFFRSLNMSRLPLRTVDDAPHAAKKGLELAQKVNGFLPNLVRLLANAPVALETYQTVSGINARGGLRLAEREVVQITAAATHGCGFCVAGHTIVAYNRAGLTEAVVNALRNNDNVPDARLNAVAAFTRAVIRSRGGVDDDELRSFRAAGFTDANALEVVLGVSLATLCNFANNLGQTELNPEYLPYAWSNPTAAAAK